MKKGTFFTFLILLFLFPLLSQSKMNDVSHKEKYNFKIKDVDVKRISMKDVTSFYGNNYRRIDTSFNLKAPSWARVYGGTHNEEAYCIRETSDGGFIYAGETDTSGSDGKYFLIEKVDSNMNVSWANSYPADNLDKCRIIQTSDGGYILVGEKKSYGDGNYDFLVVKLNSDGSVSWAKIYGGQGLDSGNSILETSDGGYMVAGSSTSYEGGNQDILLVRIDSSGNVLWAKTYGGVYSEDIYSLIQTSDGGFAIAGDTNSVSYGGLNYDFLILRLDASGHLLWNKVYGGSYIDYAYSITETTDGHFLVAGITTSFGTGYEDFLVLKLNSDGTLSWAKAYGGESGDVAYSIIENSDGNYVVVGRTWSFGNGGKDFLIIKTNANGDISWAKTYGGSEDDVPYFLIETSEGGYAVAGKTNSFGAGGDDFLILKLDSNGDITGCPYIRSCSPTATSVNPNATTQIMGVESRYSISLDVSATGSAYNGVSSGLCPIYADLLSVVAGNPNPVVAGTQIVYEVGIRNSGPDDALDVIVTDNFPPEIINPEYSWDGVNDWRSWNGHLNMDTLESNTGKIFYIRGMVASSATGVIPDTVSVSAPVIDGDLSNNSFTADTLVNRVSDLTVSMTASPDPVIAGTQITYSITISNGGPSDASNTTITDNIPPEILNPEFSIDGGNSWGAWNGDFNVGTISSGGHYEILIRGMVSSAAEGEISNSVSVSSDSEDPDTTNNSVTESTTVNTSSDLSISKGGNPDPVIAGNQITYVLDIVNNGPSDSRNVQVTDYTPPEVENPKYSTDGGNSWNLWNGSLNVGTIASGGSYQFLIRGDVAPWATISTLNSAAVSSGTPDPDDSNNSALVITTIDTLSDLSISMGGNPDPVIAGEKITYTITISNGGPSDATGIVITDDFSSHIDNPEYSTDGGSSWTPWSGSLDIGYLPFGDSYQFLIRGDVTSSTTDSVSNSASVSSGTSDPNISNNSVTVINRVNTLSDLSVSVSESPDPVIAGDRITYEIEVSNGGISDALNVKITDNLPSQILNPEYSTDGGSSWNMWNGSLDISTLTSGNSYTLLIRGVVNPSTPEGSISNSSFVISDTSDPDTSNNTASVSNSVTTSADLKITKSGNPDPVIAGSKLTYTIVITNNGPSDALNVVVNDDVPEKIEDPWFSTDGGKNWVPWSGSFNFGTLPAEKSYVLLIGGRVFSLGEGKITNSASVLSDTSDPDLSNNSATHTTTINEFADLSVSLSALPDPVTTGDKLTYTVTVVNNGPNRAENVVVKDNLPPQLTDPEYSIDGGRSWNMWSGELKKDFLIDGIDYRFVLLIRGRVETWAVSFILNTVSVSSDTRDKNDSNNVATQITDIGTCDRNYDINGDGKVNVVDLYELLNMIVGNIQMNSKGDLNCDQVVNISDAEILALYLVSVLW